MNNPSKILSNLLICLFVYLLIGLPSPVFAQTNSAAGQTSSSPFNTWVDGIGYSTGMETARNQKGVNGEAYSHFETVIPFYSIIELIQGCVVNVTCTQQQVQQNQGYIQEMNNRSAIAGISQGITAMMINPPADTRLWIADVGHSLGFLPKTYAQGVGFTGLSPILPIWKGFRNIAYSILAILMVVIGFMVMLRKKIDPKTVVTVQNALPRIIITLILITFSYAIAGFMVDLMYLTIGLGSALFAANLRNTAVSLFGQQADFYNGGFFTLLGAVFAPLINGSYDTIRNIPGNFVSMLQNQTLGPGLLLLAAAPVAGAASAVLGIIVLVVLAFAYLFGFARVFFMLVSAYIGIIISVLVGPLQILVGALPGIDGFSSWMKNIITNLIPFPVTVFFLMLGSALMQNLGTGQLWIPPFLPRVDSNTAVVGGLGVAGGAPPTSGNFAITIIWLGLILTIPSIVGTIKEALKAKGLPLGPAAVIGPMAGGGMQLLNIFYQLKFIRAPHGSLPGTEPGERQRKAMETGVQGK